MNKQLIKNNNTSSWEHIKYKNSFLSQKTIELTSCQSAASLIKPKDTVKIEFIGLGGSDTTKIEYLSKTKLSIDGMTYFKHKGNSELCNIRKNEQFFGYL
ncbi:hypothetical protein [Mesonia aquimarina]|uniref:hypothetical protein n=1 Tax=Mesonia aquimarina TaxID=1504967 RepID=UPI000EF5E401|nr:hypothetical protein [Mesonia aquimarina]